MANPANGLGSFAVTGTPLCLAVSGTIPSDGMPAIALQPCAAVAEQRFAFMLDGTIISGSNGNCLDLVSGNNAPNEALELFGCSAAANQVFTFDNKTGLLTDAAWGYCIGTC